MGYQETAGSRIYALVERWIVNVLARLTGVMKHPDYI